MRLFRAPECTGVFQVTPTEQHPPHPPYRPLRVLPPGRASQPSCMFKGRFPTLTESSTADLFHGFIRLRGSWVCTAGRESKPRISPQSTQPVGCPALCLIAGKRGHSVGLGTSGACRDLFCQQEGPAPAPAMEGTGVLLGKILVFPLPLFTTGQLERHCPAQQAGALRSPAAACLQPAVCPQLFGLISKPPE